MWSLLQLLNSAIVARKQRRQSVNKWAWLCSNKTFIYRHRDWVSYTLAQNSVLILIFFFFKHLKMQNDFKLMAHTRLDRFKFVGHSLPNPGVRKRILAVQFVSNYFLTTIERSLIPYNPKALGKSVLGIYSLLREGSYIKKQFPISCQRIHYKGFQINVCIKQCLWTE